MCIACDALKLGASDEVMNKIYLLIETLQKFEDIVLRAAETNQLAFEDVQACVQIVTLLCIEGDEEQRTAFVKNHAQFRMKSQEILH